MRRTRGVALVALVVAGALAMMVAGCGGTTTTTETKPKATGEPIKIGAVLSLTGTYAGLGGPEKNTLEMEVAAINDAGGVNGRPIEVIIEDDATDPAKAAAATTKLIDKDKVIAIIGATGTGQTMAMRGEIDRAKVPDVSIAGGTVITQQFDPLVFQTPWSNSLVVPFTLKRLQADGVKKIGVIFDSGGFGKDGDAVIKAEASKYGITVTSEQPFNVGDTDMTGQLTKIKASGAQAIVIWTAGKEAATIVKNANQLGLKLPLVGSHGNARVEFVDGAEEAGEGFTFAAGKVLVPETYGADSDEFKVAKDFIDRYTAKYGKAPDTFAGHAYDAIHIIAKAAGAVQGDLTPAALRDAIEKTTGFVGIGGTFNYTAKDHNGLVEGDLVTYVVKGGKWEVLQQTK